MKKIILSLISALGIVLGAFAETVDLPNGYYRVTNAVSDRYIHVLDNKGSLNVQTSSADMGAIILKKGIERAVSDPASVIYVENHGNNQFDFKAQNTGIYQMIGMYVNLLSSRTVPGAYLAYGSHSGVTMYLWDAKSNLNAEESYLETNGGCSRDWFVKPIDNDTENYFGVSPTHEAGGKYYASFYAAFPFSFASSGMKAYVVTKVDEAQGVAVYKEITGTVPALTPVIIECSSDNHADNKLNIGGSGNAVSGNLGKGVLFALHKNKHDNYVTYTPTMRTIGIMPDGSIGMTKGDYQDVPKNTFYLSVSSSCPDNLKLVHESEYQEGPVEATSVTLSETSLTMLPGDTHTLTATVNPANTSDKTVTWTSSNTAVATVDQQGKVTAIAPGAATITAKCGNVQATCAVKVNAIEAQSITLSQTSLSLIVGQSQTLTATVSPANTTDPTVTWSSSNTAVATVDGQGKVTAVGVGTATITAKCGNAQATCEVTVSRVEAESITLSQTSLTLTLGASATLTATVNPSNTTDPTVTWTSSNTAVATVDQHGKVTAIAIGTATITAKCGNAQATCEVTVNQVEAQSITLSQTSLTLTLGASATLTATVYPANTTDNSVTWSSANTAIATVSSTGKVTAVGIGTTTITATCGSVQATCTVTVTPIEAESITLSQTSLSLKPGATATLTATVYPANTTDPTVTWSTANPAVATVDANGTVTAVGVGTTTITATCGAAQAACTVTVMPIEATGISLNASSLSLYVGDTEQLIATVTPDDTTDPTVTWTTTNAAVATVDAQGNVTAVARGVATITAKCGNVEAQCLVTVRNVEAQAVTINPSSVTLNPGGTAQLTATVSPANTTNPDVTWMTSDPAVVTVDQNGTVTAVAVGTATVSAKCGFAMGSCTVTVSPVEATEIILDQVMMEMKTGDHCQLHATVLPDEVSDKAVSWTSTDESVVTVNPHGEVTAVGAGQAVIIATVDHVSAECTVTVTDVECEAVMLDVEVLELTEQDTYQLTAIVTPDNTTYPTVTWTSADPETATVDDNGLVTAVKAGVTTITATCGNATAQCQLTVLKLDSLDSILGDEGTYDVYTLQGVKVRSGADSLSGLPRGYYIVNGKTVLIR